MVGVAGGRRTAQRPALRSWMPGKAAPRPFRGHERRGHIQNPSRISIPQRVHVLLYHVYRPYSSASMGTLGPKHLICGNLVPLGKVCGP